MSAKSRHWVWFETSRRWIAATPAGASACFVGEGCEVAWGITAPRRPGVPPADFPECIRPARWARYLVCIALATDERLRLGSLSNAG